MDLINLVMNPVRNRIFQHLIINREATAGQLFEVMPDVPRATLYRHLNMLSGHGLVTVVSEQRIRGSVERTYAINLAALADQDTSGNLLHHAFTFLMRIYADFAQYLSEEGVDPKADRLFLSNVSLLLTDDEFERLFIDVNKLFGSHLANRPGNGRKSRSISFVSSPSKEKGV